MEVKIENFGIIQSVNIDLKPLTVFIGENNTGKTYSAYLIASIISPYGFKKYFEKLSRNEISDKYPKIDIAFDQLLKDGNCQIDLVELFTEIGSDYINNVAKLSNYWFNEYLGSSEVKTDDLKVIFDISKDLERILGYIPYQSYNSQLSPNESGIGLLNVKKEEGNPSVFFYTRESNITEKIPTSDIRDFFLKFIFLAFHRSLFKDTYIFPSERTGLVPIISTIDINQTPSKLPKDEEKRGLSQPIISLINIILNFLIMDNVKREKKATKDVRIQNFIKIANILEDRIVIGSYNKSQEKKRKIPKLLINWGTDKDIILDTAAVSSAVKGLMPLAIYLKSIADFGDMVVIDEPEMNLHPMAQAQIIELIAMMVNSGIHVIITTHSTYIVDHLVNLIKASEHPNPHLIEKEFLLKTKEAFLSKNSLNVYLFENRSARKIFDEDGFIDWSTFSDVSKYVANLYFKIDKE